MLDKADNLMEICPSRIPKDREPDATIETGWRR
jgi:hypothetical protein